jgi:hypothetical protein
VFQIFERGLCAEKNDWEGFYYVRIKAFYAMFVMIGAIR